MKIICGLLLCLAFANNNFALPSFVGVAKPIKTNKQISGTVTDHNHKLIADVIIRAVNSSTKKQHQTKSNKSGFYRFNNLPLGTYQITFEGTKEFKSKTTDNIEVGLNGGVVYNTSLDSK